MSSGPGLLSLDFDNLEREEVVACRPRVPDHEELVQEAVTSKILVEAAVVLDCWAVMEVVDFCLFAALTVKV